MRATRLAFAAVLAGLVAGSTSAGEAKQGDAYARWTDTGLTVGNAAIERTWVLQGGALKATSLRDRGGNAEWLVKPAARAAGGTLAVTATTGRRHPVEAESLSVEAVAGGRTLHVRIFPGIPGVLLGLSSGFEATATNGLALDELALAPQHLRLTETALLDQTDIRNELVFRELNAETGWTTAIPLLAPGPASVTVLGGRGTAAIRDGRLAMTIPAALDFLWVRIDPAR